MFINREAVAHLEKLLDDKKIVVILGARQVGKTTLIRSVTKNKKVCLLNLDIEIDKRRLQAAASLSPPDAIKSLGSPEILVIDEAQCLPDAARIVKGWYDAQVSVVIVLLGSSSLNLLDQSAESLAGRNRKLFLPPLLFSEILKDQEWYDESYIPEVLQNHFEKPLQQLLLERIVYGSYPEVLRTEDKEEYLQNITSDYVLKDVLQSDLIKSPHLIKQLLTELAIRVGEEISVNDLANSLQMSRLTVDRYLDLLERTYVLFRLPPFSTNQRSEITKSYKMYFWDTGVRNALLKDFNLSPFRSDINVLWQNWVIAEAAKTNLLRGNKQDLYFWRTWDGGSVDLVVKEKGDISAFTIAWQGGKAKPSRAFQQQYGLESVIISKEQPFISKLTI